MENLEVIKAILESGADTNRRLYYTETDVETEYPIELPGPTLIHAVLAKRTDFQFEDEVRFVFKRQDSDEGLMSNLLAALWPFILYL